MRVLTVPVVTDSAEGIADGACGDREGMLSAGRINHTHPLNRRIKPHAGQFHEIHRIVSMKSNGHARIGVEQNASAEAVEKYPIRHLRHRSPAVKVVILDDHTRRVLQISDLERHSIA